MTAAEGVKHIVGEILQLGERTYHLKEDSPLLGGVPEFDSMAVVSILTRIEEDYGIMINDDEVTAEVFETMGSLIAFVAAKTN